MDWLWIVLIVVGAAIACVLVWAYSNRKKIFKKQSKDEKKAKKQTKKILKDEKNAKKALKAAPVVPAEEKKESDELSFSENQIETIEHPEVKSEVYIPSDDFVQNDIQQYEGVPRRMPRRRPVELPRREYNFETPVERVSIKDQLRALTPEMKAVVFGNLLDRKDEQF